MKRCPQCNQTYSDSSLKFCLSDGSPLSAFKDPEETLIIDGTFKIEEQNMTFPLEVFRVYCLFGYETDGGRESQLWNDPMSFHRPLRENRLDVLKNFNSWRRTKRKFSRGELLDGTWVKIADHGHQHRLELHDDGTLTENSLFSFNEDDSWGGEWKIIEGVLRLNIQIYELDVVASVDGLHSGIEDENNHRNAYFRVIHVK